MTKSETTRYLSILLIPFLIKCVFASTTELTNDEAYYWTYAQHLQWSYFDHPPMIALMIRLSTVNLLLQHEFFLRLGPSLYLDDRAKQLMKPGAFVICDYWFPLTTKAFAEPVTKTGRMHFG